MDDHRILLDPMGLTPSEAQHAIRLAVWEKEAAAQRGRDQRAAYERYLRRQGFTEDEIARR